jgi:hypothetical protein
MSNLSRRSLVASAAALPALAVPAMAEQNPQSGHVTDDPIYAAIEHYKYWNQRTDELWDDRPSPEAEAARDAAVNARWRLCDTAPASWTGLVALLDFAMSEQARLECPLPDDHDETMNFIAALSRCVSGLTPAKRSASI